MKNECHVGSKTRLNQLYLKFEINDNGRGISKDKIGKIFDEQETDQSGENMDGTGLGLPICLAICKNMDGFIKYASVQNKSTIFRLYVPYEDYLRKQTLKVHSTNTPLTSEESVIIHKCNQILLAEDNPNIIKKYKNILLSIKVDYKTFLNGQALFDYVKDYKFCCTCKLLVLTDKNMPIMDGIQLAKHLRDEKLTINHSIVLVSAEDYNNYDLLFNDV